MALARRARRRLRRHRHLAALRDEASASRRSTSTRTRSRRRSTNVLGVAVAVLLGARSSSSSSSTWSSCCAPTTRAKAASSRSPRSSRRSDAPQRTRLAIPILLALFGAGLLFGDGVITPAISVLGAIEGLAEQSPSLADARSSRSRSRSSIGAVLGPALRHRQDRRGVRLGDAAVVRRDRRRRPARTSCAPRASCRRCQPALRASMFLAHHGMHGFLLLGSVVLCVTGGEALYADMGHFGKHADPHRVVRRSCSRACSSTTSARARCTSQRGREGREPVLRARRAARRC